MRWCATSTYHVLMIKSYHSAPGYKEKILRPILKERSLKIREFLKSFTFSTYFCLINIFLFVIPQNGALFDNFRLQTDGEILFCRSRCAFLYIILKNSHEGTETEQWQRGDKGRKDCCAQKLCCAQPHIFLICLVWNSSFSNSGFVTFSEGTENIWTPYGSHLLFAKWSYILFSKPFISPSIATTGF